MNRYLRRGRYAQFTPMSMQELSVLPGMKQQEHMQSLEASLAMQQDEQPVLSKDQEVYSKGIQEVNTGIDNIINQLQEKGVSPDIGKSLLETRKKVQDFNAPTGLGGMAMQSKAARDAAIKQLREREGLSGTDMMVQERMWDAAYEGVQSGNIYQAGRIQDTVNIEETLVERLDKMPKQTIDTWLNNKGSVYGYHKAVEDGQIVWYSGKEKITYKDPKLLYQVANSMMATDPYLSEYANFLRQSAGYRYSPGEDGSYQIGEETFTDPTKLAERHIQAMVGNAVARTAFKEEKLDSKLSASFIPKAWANSMGLLNDFGQTIVNPGASQTLQGYDGMDNVTARLNQLNAQGELTPEEKAEQARLSSAKQATMDYLREYRPEVLDKHSKAIDEASWLADSSFWSASTGGEPPIKLSNKEQNLYGGLSNFLAETRATAGEEKAREYFDLITRSSRKDLEELPFYSQLERHIVKASPNTKQLMLGAEGMGITPMIELPSLMNKLNPKIKEEAKLNKEIDNLVENGQVITGLEFSPGISEDTDLRKMRTALQNTVTPYMFKLTAEDDKLYAEKDDNKTSEIIKNLPAKNIKTFNLVTGGEGTMGIKIGIAEGKGDDSKIKHYTLMPREGTEYYNDNTMTSLIDGLFGKGSVASEYYKGEFNFRDMIAVSPGTETDYNVLEAMAPKLGIRGEPTVHMKLLKKKNSAGFNLEIDGNVLPVDFASKTDVMYYLQTKAESFYNIEQ